MMSGGAAFGSASVGVTAVGQQQQQQQLRHRPHAGTQEAKALETEGVRLLVAADATGELQVRV